MSESYRQFIDAMVDLARGSVTADRIRANGHSERVNDRALALCPEEIERKRILLSMTDEQRKVVAELIADERIGGVHDVIANLDVFDFRIEGKLLFDQADEEPKFDFINRLDDGSWYDK